MENTKASVESFRDKAILKRLILRHSDLTDDHIFQLVPCIPYLQYLDLSFNENITSQGYEALANKIKQSAIENQNSLKELSLTRCDLTDDDIFTLLPCIPFLQKVDISFNKNITSQGYNILETTIKEAAIENQNLLKKLKLD